MPSATSLAAARSLSLNSTAKSSRAFARLHGSDYDEQPRIAYRAEGGSGYTMTADPGFPVTTIAGGRVVRSVDTAIRQGAPGHIARGPVLALPTEGPHRITAELQCTTARSGNPDRCPVGVVATIEVWDVTDNKKLIDFDVDSDELEGQNRISPRYFTVITAPGFFYAPTGHQIEYRVWWTGVADLYVDRFIVNDHIYQ